MSVEIPQRPEPPLRIGISLCLLGERVRHDGGHRRDALCHELLEGLFEYEGVCPEVAIGMGVPRDPIRLVGEADAPRARGVEDASVDVTQALEDFARRVDTARRVGTTHRDVAGHILMSGSPSCGIRGVPVYDAITGDRMGRGSGVYAREIMAADPCLPVEESARLNEPASRESFVTRVFAYAHWKLLAQQGSSVAGLSEFHSRYKYLLMAHSTAQYQRLGRLLADPGGCPTDELALRYIGGLMSGLARPATRATHADVLSHLQETLRRELDRQSREELAEAIEAYARGDGSLAAAVGLLERHLRSYRGADVSTRVYLEPHPAWRECRNVL